MIRLKLPVTLACLGAALVLHTMAFHCLAQDLPSGVQDVVKLVKAGLGEDLVLSQIKNTGTHYALSVDQIIYLHGQGVTESEIKALLGPTNSTSAPAPVPAPTLPTPVALNPAPAPAVTAPNPTPATAPAPAPATLAPAPAAPVYAPTTSTPAGAVAPAAPTVSMAPAQPASMDYFQAQLAPYGNWTDVPGVGLCWRPNVAATDPYWRPYSDQGHWLYTADGWYWQSDFPWGGIVFHYGRWFRDSTGWDWAPGYDWAPAWVCWRQADGYCGWAPLPPAAVFKPSVGLWYHDRLAVNVDFGLSSDAFIFVPYDHFWDHDFHGYLLPRDRVVVVFGRSAVINGYRVEHGRLIVAGIGYERMAVLTHHDVRVEVHEGVRAHEDRRIVHDDRKVRHDW